MGPGLAVALASVVFAPVLEELLFRGVLLPCLAARMPLSTAVGPWALLVASKHSCPCICQCLAQQQRFCSLMSKHEPVLCLAIHEAARRAGAAEQRRVCWQPPGAAAGRRAAGSARLRTGVHSDCIGGKPGSSDARPCAVQRRGACGRAAVTRYRSVGPRLMCGAEYLHSTNILRRAPVKE